MKLKALLILLLVLAGFTHSAFDLYGVDLGKLKIVEDSSKNQDRDYNDAVFKYNPIDVWEQGKSLKPWKMKVSPEAAGASLINRMKVAPNAGELWKNTNKTKYLNRPSSATEGAIVENLDVDTMSMELADRNNDRVGTSMASPKQPKAESVKLKFINGEWVEIRVIDTALDEIVEIEPLDGGTTAVSATCGPGINLCILPGDTCSYSDHSNTYFCICDGVLWNCNKNNL